MAHLLAGVFGGFAAFKGTYNTEASSEGQETEEDNSYTIVVGENEPAESAIRRFRRAVMQANVIPEVRRRRYFETPQDIKKRKEADKHARKRSERRQAAARARNTN